MKDVFDMIWVILVDVMLAFLEGFLEFVFIVVGMVCFFRGCQWHHSFGRGYAVGDHFQWDIIGVCSLCWRENPSGFSMRFLPRGYADWGFARGIDLYSDSPLG